MRVKEDWACYLAVLVVIVCANQNKGGKHDAKTTS